MTAPAPIEKRIRVSPVYVRNAQAYGLGWRVIANQGGTRSTKTFSIMYLLASLLQGTYAEPLTITATSHSLPHLKRGALRDFETILHKEGWYNRQNINLTDKVYHFGENYIEFFSADKGDKVRGPGRKVLFINECNLIEEDTFKQLAFRTQQTIIIDYNPSDEHHWIYDRVLTRSDCFFIKSTYLEAWDFLPAEQIDEIERLRDADPEYWKVFGMGERGKSGETIYTHWCTCDALPGRPHWYGLDFGFNHQTSLTAGYEGEKGRYVHQLIHQSGLTTPELIDLMKEVIPPAERRTVTIYADPEDPKAIADIERAGFKIEKADKAVTDGILEMKARPLFITEDSVDLLKEIRGYKWKIDPKTGEATDQPVKFRDHAMDSMRYGAYTYVQKGKNGPKPITKSRTLSSKR